MSEYRELTTNSRQIAYGQPEDATTSAECQCKYWHHLCKAEKRDLCVRAGLCLNSIDGPIDKIMDVKNLATSSAEDAMHATAYFYGDMAKDPKKLAKHQRALETCRMITPMFVFRMDDPGDLLPKKKTKKKKPPKDVGRKLEID